MAERDDRPMKDRREALVAFGAGALGLAALPALPARASTPAPAASPAPDDLADCAPADVGRAAHLLPRVTVTTHLGERVRFYEDLVANRTVLVHFMSIAEETHHPAVANLARAQEYLGDRLGRDLFIYSLGRDPGRDTPRALAELAARHGARPGWLFLHAEADDVERLKQSFFVDRVGRGAHDHAGHRAGPDCSRGLVRYGNDATGLWGSCPALADPRWLAARLSWVSPAPPPEGPPRRRGPRPLVTRGGRS